MSPHLVKWDKKYRSAGLTVIDVNNGRMDKHPALARYVKQHKKAYPTLWDKDGKVCAEYAVRGYPAAFLIGVDGKVVWEGFPVGELKTLEQQILKQLAGVAKPTSRPAGKKNKATSRPQSTPPKLGVQKAKAG